MLFGIFCMQIVILLALCALVWSVDGMRVAMQFRTRKVIKMTAAFDALKAEVESEKSVAAGAVTLLNGLISKLENVTTDDDISALVTEMKANVQPLAQAVAAGTRGASADAATGTTPPVTASAPTAGSAAPSNPDQPTAQAPQGSTGTAGSPS